MKIVFGVMITLLMASVLCLWAAPSNGTISCPSSGNVSLSNTTLKVATYAVTAPLSNTGQICIGGLGTTTSNGVCLVPAQSFSAAPQGNSQPYDLSTVYVACTVNTDTIRWIKP